MNSYDIGDQVRSTVNFADITGAAADPTTVTARIKPPTGAVTVIVYPTTGVVRDSLGTFHVDVEPTSEGLWWVRWEGTGTVKTAIEHAFTVHASRVI